MVLTLWTHLSAWNGYPAKAWCALAVREWIAVVEGEQREQQWKQGRKVRAGVASRSRG